jgi:oxalate decarboxylase
VTERELPVATTLAGVNMSLEPGAVREMHWHTEAESAYMLSGCARIAAVEPTGRASADEVEEGDLWYFRPASRTPFQAMARGCSCSTTAASRRTRPS